MNTPAKKAGLAEVVRWVIGTLIGLAQGRGYGTIRIVVQAGQIEFVHLEQSWTTNTLPATKPVPDQVVAEAMRRS